MDKVTARLWVVATPLGNIEDLSPRARRILATVDGILAEDTRRAQRLLQSCGIKATKVVSYHDHNEEEKLGLALQLLRKGSSLALISDAGTPLLADPGYELVRSCRKEGILVSPVPGPSAPVAALSCAGLPPLPYSFLGFLPRDAAGKKQLFTAFAHSPGTIIFFERSDRLQESLATALEILGSREVALCRELTKIHEEVLQLRLDEAENLPELLGELTVLIGPSCVEERSDEEAVLGLLETFLHAGLHDKDVVRSVKERTKGWSGKELYKLLQAKKSGAVPSNTVIAERA